MTSIGSPAPRGEEIIAPIRVRSSPANGQTAGRRNSRRVRVAASLSLIAVLAVGGAWWIGHLSHHPPATVLDALSDVAPRLSPNPSPTSALTSADTQRAPTPQPPASATPAVPADPQRTETVEVLRQQLASAENLEAAGNLAAAQSAFQGALRMDPKSQTAREGSSRPAAEEFRRWMVEGYAALNAGDLVQAQSHFLRAQALRPGAAEVAEALAQAEDRRRIARIETARQKALAADQREDWAGALAAYEEALGMEPTLQFAQQGKERAAARLALERRIAFFVNQPGVLDFDAQLESAIRLLRELQSAPPIGSRLRAEADRLESLVQAAQTPVRVMLESDSQTEVSVYRVGRLGRFITRELSLRPGRYTVVGSRDGHQDERLDFVVQPGSEPVRITVVCKVKV